ncbi:MAG: efflux RND transporter periplasmic adaptor subunit [Planctomycetota bacterium]
MAHNAPVRSIPLRLPRSRTATAALAAASMCLALAPTVAAHGASQDARRGSAQAADPLSRDPAWVAVFDGIYHFAEPSKDARMGFAQPSEIRDILVRTGDRVAKGDVLVRARDGGAREAVNLQRRRAENRLEILSAENDLALAQIEFDNQERAREDGASNNLEYDRSKTRLEAAKLQLDAAHERFTEQGITLKRLESELERFSLIAQFDGVVESVEVSPGQVMQDSAPVLRLVAIDPLHIRLPTPTSMIRVGQDDEIKPGNDAWVVMNVAGDPKMVRGRVLEVSPVANFAADRVTVKIEIPNAERLLAGLQAWVRFEEPSAEFMQTLARYPGSIMPAPDIDANPTAVADAP